jgi:tetratricopeptide (TPR) repeat protein
MSDQWNRTLFYEFTRLRDQSRAAKKEKNYQEVLSSGTKIIELDKNAKFIGIVTAIFLKDMGNACIKLGDHTAAVKYLLAAKAKFVEQTNDPGCWKRDIELIEKTVRKLQGN